MLVSCGICERLDRVLQLLRVERATGIDVKLVEQLIDLHVARLERQLGAEHEAKLGAAHLHVAVLIPHPDEVARALLLQLREHLSQLALERVLILRRAQSGPQRSHGSECCLLLNTQLLRSLDRFRRNRWWRRSIASALFSDRRHHWRRSVQLCRWGLSLLDTALATTASALAGRTAAMAALRTARTAFRRPPTELRRGRRRHLICRQGGLLCRRHGPARPPLLAARCALAAPRRAPEAKSSKQTSMCHSVENNGLQSTCVAVSKLL